MLNVLDVHCIGDARQIFYAARDPVQERTGQELRAQYFTQTLLPLYLRKNPAQTADWDVVFDARGHFLEPHTGRSVPLGGVAAWLGLKRRLGGERAAYEQLLHHQIEFTHLSSFLAAIHAEFGCSSPEQDALQVPAGRCP